jgi:hypothetical protein
MSLRKARRRVPLVVLVADSRSKNTMMKTMRMMNPLRMTVLELALVEKKEEKTRRMRTTSMAKMKEAML